MPAKKPNQPKTEDMSTTTPMGGSDSDDIFIVSGASDIQMDLDYGAAQGVYTIGNLDTITLDSITIDPSYISTGSTMNWSSDYNLSSYNSNPSVNITGNGVDIKENCDLKIGDRSLKDFMDKVEDQLAILRPAPELEEKWDKLKELRRQYEECKQDILEKEKIMKILKED